LLSFSKAAWVGLPLGLLLGLGPRRGGLIRAAVPLCLLGAAVLLLPSQAREWIDGAMRLRLDLSGSWHERVQGWESAWSAVSEWALLGVGAGGDLRYTGGVHVHSFPLAFAVCFGIPAALLHLGSRILLVWEAWTKRGRSHMDPFLLGFVLAEIQLLVHPLYWMRGLWLPLLLLAWRSRRGEEAA
jgi:hypothetical protein